MAADPFTVDPQPSAGDVQFLEDRINEFNAARTGIDDGRLLSIFVRDESGAMTAGLYGWTWGGACEIRFLWVREDLRGQGYGSRLLQAAERRGLHSPRTLVPGLDPLHFPLRGSSGAGGRAEQEAAARGCRRMVLATHTFQAPAFYQKLGYQAAGAFDEYPRGHRQIFLQKRL